MNEGNTQTVTNNVGQLHVIATIALLFAALTSTVTMGIATHMVLAMGTIERKQAEQVQQTDYARSWREHMDRRVDELERSK